MLRWFALLSLLGLVACARNSQQTAPLAEDGVTMSLEVVPDPVVVGPSELRIHLQDTAGAAIDDAQLSLKGDMSHAGMTPVLASVNGGEDGLYTVPFAWTMGGDWYVTVVATLADGRVITRRFDLSVGGGM